MGLFSRQKPKIKVQTTKKDGFSGWVKCTHCSEMVHASELHEQHNCCPKCNYHYRLSATQRVSLLADAGTFQEMFTDLKPADPLQFVDQEPYPDRIRRAQEKTGRDEAAMVGICEMKGEKCALGVMDFTYMGGSMGSVVGERLTSLIEYATANTLPLVIVSASGGARMQESILSLMQMAKTSSALARHADEGLLYISVLTNPTTGGVTASFASLGDLIIAEPKALIGFAGPRVVEQTTRQKLPEGAQTSEFLLEKGMIDGIVSRCDLKEKIAYFMNFFTKIKRSSSQKNMFPNKLRELLAPPLKEAAENVTDA
ncbi:MAG: acetyl-CoA carboxylase, carboxyltransferase subunit beta [Candidatus Algichlamydia australiensis]|nr:acetyl-CoA carboxylase, carboxyltransferase subunit beta [Chlamydiales bacterium]